MCSKMPVNDQNNVKKTLPIYEISEGLEKII